MSVVVVLIATPTIAQIATSWAICAMPGALEPQAAPFYAWVRQQRGWEPAWNFCKVLIGGDGRIAGTYGSRDEPDGPALRDAITAELRRTPTG